MIKICIWERLQELEKAHLTETTFFGALLYKYILDIFFFPFSPTHCKSLSKPGVKTA